MTKGELNKVIQLIETHKETDELGYCDTGADMEYGCRSECVDMAAQRVVDYFKDKCTS